MQDNEVMCPKCLKIITLCPSNEEYVEEPLIYCKDCDMEFEGIAISAQQFWYEINFAEFANLYLRLRGYVGIPVSWYAVGCYMENYIKGNREIPESWKENESFIDAHNILEKYFDLEPKEVLD